MSIEVLNSTYYSSDDIQMMYENIRTELANTIKKQGDIFLLNEYQQIRVNFNRVKEITVSLHSHTIDNKTFRFFKINFPFKSVLWANPLEAITLVENTSIPERFTAPLNNLILDHLITVKRQYHFAQNSKISSRKALVVGILANLKPPVIHLREKIDAEDKKKVRINTIQDKITELRSRRNMRESELQNYTRMIESSKIALNDIEKKILDAEAELSVLMSSK